MCQHWQKIDIRIIKDQVEEDSRRQANFQVPILQLQLRQRVLFSPTCYETCDKCPSSMYPVLLQVQGTEQDEQAHQGSTVVAFL